MKPTHIEEAITTWTPREYGSTKFGVTPRGGSRAGRSPNVDRSRSPISREPIFSGTYGELNVGMIRSATERDRQRNIHIVGSSAKS